MHDGGDHVTIAATPTCGIHPVSHFETSPVMRRDAGGRGRVYIHVYTLYIKRKICNGFA